MDTRTAYYFGRAYGIMCTCHPFLCIPAATERFTRDPLGEMGSCLVRARNVGIDEATGKRLRIMTDLIDGNDASLHESMGPDEREAFASGYAAGVRPFSAKAEARRAGISQQELAERFGVSVRTIQRWYLGGKHSLLLEKTIFDMENERAAEARACAPAEAEAESPAEPEVSAEPEPKAAPCIAAVPPAKNKPASSNISVALAALQGRIS